MSDETRHGSYANPRRQLLQTVEQFAAQDRAAVAAGHASWAEWARERLHVEPTPTPKRKPRA